MEPLPENEAARRAAECRHDDGFRALADPTRRRLVALLLAGEACVGDLVEVLELPQPTVSRHLAHLRRAGWVAVRRDSPWVHYRLALHADPVRTALVDALRLAADDEPYRTDATRARLLRETGGCCPEPSEERGGTCEGDEQEDPS